MLDDEYRATFRAFTEQEAIFETLAVAGARPDEVALALKALENARRAHSAARDQFALSLFKDSSFQDTSSSAQRAAGQATMCCAA